MDLGHLQRYLGLQITRDIAAHTITLTTSHMVHEILTCFCLQFSSTHPTPLGVDQKLTAPDLEESFDPSGPYAELVGCLLGRSPSASKRDHFLSVFPTTLTVDLLEQRLLAAETSIVAVGASRGDPRTPVFEGCSPSPLLPSLASAAVTDLGGFEALVGLAGAVEVLILAVEGVGVVVGGVAGVEVSVAAVEAEEAVAVAEGAEAVEVAEVAEAAEAAVELVAALRRGVPPVAWYAGRQRGGGTGPCTYVLRTGDRAGEQCGGLHSTHRCFGRLTDAWRHQFPDATEIPRWGDLSRAGVAIFDLDYDAILAAMYAVSTSDEGDCYLCLPPDPGGEAAALGACEAAALGASASAAPGAGESALSGTASAQVFHTFCLDLGASHSFFRDRTTLTPLSRLVAVSLADPSGGPVLASFSTVLPCPAAPSGTLSGLYLPSFSTNLVSGADLQDQGVDQFTPAIQRVTHCTCARTGRHLATFTRRPGSSLYTLSTESPPVPVSGQVAASSQVFAAASGSGPESLRPAHVVSCPTRLSSGTTALVTPPCLASKAWPPVSLSLVSPEAPQQTLHMDVWGPARVRGQGHERYFLLVVDDYSCYTTVFPLRSKGDVTEVLIDWIRAARLQLRESFDSDFPVLRLHSDRGGLFSPARLGAFCSAQGIRQTFTLPASPQQNGIAERRIGMVMDVAPPGLLARDLPNLAVGKVGDASAFRVCGSRAFVRDLSADKLSPRAVPCVFLGFPPDASGWLFYHPTSRRVLSSQDVTFDESVPYYRLFPYRIAPLPPPPLFLAPSPPPVDPLPPQGPALSGVSQVDTVEPVKVAVDSGAARGAEPVGAESGGAEPRGAESGGAEPGGAEPGAAESRGAEPGGTEPGGAEAARVASRSASSRRELLSPQELRESFAWRWSRAAGAGGPPVAPSPGGARTCGTGALGTGGSAAATGVGPAGASGAAGAGAAGGVVVGVGAPRASRAAGAGAAGGVGAGVGLAGGTSGAAGGTGAAGTGAAAGVGGVGAGGAAGTGAATGGTGAVPVGSRGPARPRPYFVPLLEQVLRLSPSPGPAPPLECPPPVQSLSPLEPVSPLPAPSPYAGPTGGLAERREPASRPASPVRTPRTSRRASRPCPLAVPGTHQMTLRPSTAPLRVPLSSPPESSLPVLADPASDSLRVASPTVARLLSTVVTDPSFESTAASALVAELVDFAARCRLDYAAGLVVEVKRPPGSPPVFKARYVARGFSQRQGVDYFQTFSPTPKMTTLWVLVHVAAQRDYELHSLDFSTAFLQGSLHEEIWLRRPPGFTGSFPLGTQWSLRRQVYGLRQAPREWHDTLRTTLAALGFAPSTADPSLFLRTDTSLPPFYILVYVDDLVFATADTAGLAHLKSELQKRHTCTDLGELRSYLGLLITRDRAQRAITLAQSRMLQQVIQRFDFTYSLPQATPLSTRHSLSALPSDESIEPSGPYPELVGCLMYLMTCTRPNLAYPLSILARYVAPGRHRPEHMAAAKRVLRYLCSHADASWADDQATQRSSQGYTFSLGSGSVSWQSTRSSSVLGSSCEAEIYAGAMAAQELRWLTFLLADLGEPPRFPPVLYQRGQLRLAYVASQANTADIFTKALPPGDHQRFCTMLACFALLDWSCDLLFSPTLPMGVCQTYMLYSL
ncbi:unnamed protein product [Closterium sp. NIES-53]